MVVTYLPVLPITWSRLVATTFFTFSFLTTGLVNINSSKESFWDRLKKVLHPEEHPTPEINEEFDKENGIEFYFDIHTINKKTNEEKWKDDV